MMDLFVFDDLLRPGYRHGRRSDAEGLLMRSVTLVFFFFFSFFFFYYNEEGWACSLAAQAEQGDHAVPGLTQLVD